MLVCGASLQSPRVVTGGPRGRGVTNGIRATLRPWLIVCSVHLAWEKILKVRSNVDVVFLSGGECDTLDLAFKKGLIDYLYQQRAFSFHGSPCGAILEWVTSCEVFLSAHE